MGALGTASAAYSLLQPGRTPVTNPESIWPDTGERHALVCGVGGVGGAVWQAGVLQWLEERGTRLRDTPLIIGTSAGSLIATLSRTKLATEELVELAANGEITLNGIKVTLPEIESDELPDGRGHHARDSLAQPFRAIASGRFPSLAGAVAGLIPTGRFSLEHLADTVDYIWWKHGDTARWPQQATWVVAVDLANGQRTCFGVEGEPEATCGQAVAASCAVPGVLRPVPIGSKRYVDGGVCSFTNLDLAVSAGATNITVLNPIGTPRKNVNNTLVGRGEALLRRSQARSMANSIDKARRSGIDVTLYAPTQHELDAMGDRLLDFTRAEQILESIKQRQISGQPA